MSRQRLMRDITESDPGRGGRGARLAVIAVAAAVILATLVAVQPKTRASGSRPEPTPIPLPRSAGLLGAAFPDGQHAWLLTGDGSGGERVWRSEDGGQNWNLAMNLPDATVVGAFRLGLNGTGYLATLTLPQGAGPNGLWLTSDAGRSFEEHPFPSPPGYLLIGVSAPADGSAHAFFSDEDFPPSALVYEREPIDGGSWTLVSTLGPGRRPVASPPAEPIPIFGSQTAFAFLDQAHGVIATQTDTAGLGVFRTADGGRTWTFARLGPPPNGEQLPPAALAVTASGGKLVMSASFEAGTAPPAAYLYESGDGGATWSDPVEIPTDDGLETASFLSDQLWWVPLGKGVLVTGDAGRHWFRGGLDLPGTTRVEAVYPIDGRSAWAFGGTALGPPQLLYRTIDAGSTWTVVKPPG